MIINYIKFITYGLMDKMKAITKITAYLYVIWFAVNLYALSYGLVHPKRYFLGPGRRGGGAVYGDINNSSVYPFESSQLGTYDLSEFCLYVIAIPLVLYALYRIIETLRRPK